MKKMRLGEISKLTLVNYLRNRGAWIQPGSDTYDIRFQTTQPSAPTQALIPQTLALSFWRLVREWKIPWSLRFSLRK